MDEKEKQILNTYSNYSIEIKSTIGVSFDTYKTIISFFQGFLNYFLVSFIRELDKNEKNHFESYINSIKKICSDNKVEVLISRNCPKCLDVNSFYVRFSKCYFTVGCFNGDCHYYKEF